MNENKKKHLKKVFEGWIEDQISNWIDEPESWDNLIEDGDIDEEDWEFIRRKLKVTKIEIVEVE